MRMISAGPLSRGSTGLPNRPPPRPASTSRVSEPGSIVTRPVGPPGVEEPPATPTVASRLVTSGEPAGVDRGGADPGAIGHGGAKLPLPTLSSTLTWPVTSLVTTRSGRPSPVVSTAWTSETPRPTESVTAGGTGSFGTPVQKLPSPLSRKDRQRPVAGIADHQVVPAVAVEVGGDDLGRERAGRQRPDQVETAVAIGIERDGVVLGVDAGQQRA